MGASMSEKWTAALQSAGLNLDKDSVILHFGKPEEEKRLAVEAAVMADLTQFGLIRISGADAQKFLQSQFTNDVKQASASQAQLSAWCSAKGRVIATFILYRRDGDFMLLLPAASVAGVMARLQRYVLRADVQLHDAGKDLARMGVSGEHAGQWLEAYLGQPPPAEMYGCLAAEKHTVLRIPGTKPRFVVIGEQRAVMECWLALFGDAKPAGAAAWELLDILAGMPWLAPTLGEEFIPQMLNLEKIGGVSFTKGCYPGQEIVARSQYLGEVKRRMARARVTTTECPSPGSVLLTGDGQAAGTVIAGQCDPQGECVLLVVLNLNAGELHLPNGTPARLESLVEPAADGG
jgi:folate-binding protein YgfZ